MATSKDFNDYVLERLSAIGEVSSRKMMGEYCIYYRDKVVIILSDNMLFLKPTPSALKYYPEAKRDYPYEGSKTLMLVIEDIEDTERLQQAVLAVYEELPAPNRKGKKT